MIALDADKLLFDVTQSKYVKGSFFNNSADSGVIKSDYKEPLKPYKRRFKELIKETEDEIAVALLGKVKIKGIEAILSDPKSNFRYDIYPEYKANRTESDRGDLFRRLKKWACKKYRWEKGFEADDVVSYLVSEHGYVGATFDKDMLRGVAGTWFDTYHTRRYAIETTEDDARRFNLIQVIMGDSVDNIKALPKKAGDPMIPCDIEKLGLSKQPFKMTEKLAGEALDEHGWDWDGVIKVFEQQGYGEKEAVLNLQLTSMEQYVGKSKPKLKHKI